MGENIKITIFNHKIFAVLNIYLNFAFNITKVQFFKDFSKLSETSDLFIVETDQFGLIDGNGNSYDFDSRENF